MYRVQAWCPVLEGTQGGQFWGSTVVEPGQAGSEYFMTHGHFHLKRDRTEYYGTIEGDGTLILMDGNRKTWMERMSARSLHFVPPNTAHRVANIGKAPLRLVACWPSDAGHDYESVRRHGFGARLRNIHGEPKLLGAARNFPFARSSVSQLEFNTGLDIRFSKDELDFHYVVFRLLLQPLGHPEPDDPGGPNVTFATVCEGKNRQFLVDALPGMRGGCCRANRIRRN